jgi:hypothetical protein
MRKAVERSSPSLVYSKVCRVGIGYMPSTGMGLSILSGRVGEEIDLPRVR